ncbi:Alpha/Beta hydrolase protein [Cercophora newfieldiana]|uniref:Alpha/Beta hydrolase protein n=1 Tax=Cercophora newfieldiana TaxID=92897 RepID=A0AA40CLL1_9PEZI|nr:Alpha/Beta hydrolase protein [Cercophora newfieldiana]
MRWTYAFPLLASATTVLATINFNQFHPDLAKRQIQAHQFRDEQEPVEKRQAQPIPQPQGLFLTNTTRQFAINGTGIPEVDFDVGESYAGLLPIDNNDPTNQLFFWFFPSTNPVAQEKKEILIWLTGGPGCSSVGELLQENGPMLWVPGTLKPVENKWSWHHLTNVVWIDQPVGSGFSQGTPSARDEADVARQFLGFWRNFVETFALQGFSIYVTGSSYSGMYSPYISSAMLDQNDETFFNLTGMMIFDGLFSKDPIARDIPVATFVNQWNTVLPFNDSFTDTIQLAADQCGYTDYLRRFMTFPPRASNPPSSRANTQTTPPAPSTNFQPPGAPTVFLNRPDVKAAINAPVDHEWEFCASSPVFVNNTDLSQNAGPGSQPVLPRVIDATQNVLLGHGSRDFVLIADGTLLTIQNLTWGGQLGFQSRPTSPLFIPYHDNSDFANIAGAGIVGTTHSERGLTYFGAATAGHFLTQDQPAVAFRGVEILLGRVPNFQSTVPFTTDLNATAQPAVGALGNGTFAALFLEAKQEVAALANGGNFVGGIPGTAQSLGAVVTAGAERMGVTSKGAVVALGVVAGEEPCDANSHRSASDTPTSTPSRHINPDTFPLRRVIPGWPATRPLPPPPSGAAFAALEDPTPSPPLEVPPPNPPGPVGDLDAIIFGTSTRPTISRDEDRLLDARLAEARRNCGLNVPLVFAPPPDAPNRTAPQNIAFVAWARLPRRQA